MTSTSSTTVPVVRVAIDVAKLMHQVLIELPIRAVEHLEDRTAEGGNNDRRDEESPGPLRESRMQARLAFY